MLAALTAFSQDFSAYAKKQWISGNDTLPYRILLPEGYNPAKKYPLVFFLHGAGERGNDNEKQLTHGAALFLQQEARKNYPAIVVFPQCPRNSFWSNVSFKRGENNESLFMFHAGPPPTSAMRMADSLLHFIIRKYPVQTRQVYVMGLSMGAMGTFELAYRNPSVFAAAVPICGGGAAAFAPAVREVKWWIFHGAADNVVPPRYSLIMEEALKKAGADVKLTMYDGVGHNSWDLTFAEKELLPWLFAQKRK